MRFALAALSALSLSALAPPCPAQAKGAELDDARTPPVVTARAVVRAGESVDIAAALSQRLLSAPFKPGQYVKRGAELARFDCRRLEADLAAAEQAVITLSLRHDSQAELERFGAAGELDVRVAASERDQAAAQAAAIRAATVDCVVSAPFNAHVKARHVGAHETPQAGQPIYSLIRAGDIELSVIVPARLGATLSAGDAFELHMDGAADSTQATVTRLAPDIDPVSQTREVFARPARRAGLKPGMSGEARFSSRP